MTPKRFALSVATAASLSLVLWSCGDGGGGGSPTTPADPVVAVVVTPATVRLDVGETVQLRAEARLASGATRSNPAVSWASADGSVASVSASGLVTGAGAGETSVTASVPGVSGQARATVRGGDAITVSLPDTVRLGALGDTLTATAVLRWSDGSTGGGDLSWSVEPAGIVEVAAGSCAEPCATLSALANGGATLTVSGAGVSATRAIEVRQELASAEARDTVLTGVGVQSIPVPFTDLRDRNGNALDGEIADSALAAVGIAETALVPGFEPGALLDAGALTIAYAGTVELDLGVASATVTVAPGEPEIYGLQSPETVTSGDEVQVLGARMDQLSAADLSLGAGSALAVTNTSATALSLSVTFPDLQCSDEPRVTLGTTAEVRGDLVVQRQVGTLVELEPGATQLMTEASACWQVPDGRYLVAFADMGYVERARTEAMATIAGWPEWTAYDGTWTLRAIDHISGGGAAAPRVFAESRARERGQERFGESDMVTPSVDLPIMPQLSEDLPEIADLTQPVVVGDRLSVGMDTDPTRLGNEVLAPATVMHVNSGFVVLLHDEDQQLVEDHPEMLEEFIAMVDRFVEKALPTFQSVFDTKFPRGISNDQVVLDQYFLVVGIGSRSFATYPVATVGGRSTPPSETCQRFCHWFGGGRTLAHEITHGFQWHARLSKDGWRRETWWVEGGAVVGEWVAFETESVDPEWLAHPCRDLGPWEDCRGGAPGRWAPGPPSTSLDGSGRYYGWNTLPFGEGHLVSWWFGYNSSALLFREYAARYREATGVPFLEALGVVVRAAMLGFHGLEAGAGRGLIPTVSGVVPGLDPGEAHLQAVLGDMNLKEQVPMPERYMWHGGRTVWFNMHLLAGLGTDYTQTISRMSHGLFSYDVPEGHGFGRLELITNASGMQYLILRLE